MTDRPFDISVKDLAEQDPLSWSRLGERRLVDSATVIDADLSTVTAAADKVIRVQSGAHAWLLNLEAVSSHDSGLPRRLHLKSVLLEERHDLPVRSVVLLLRRQANARGTTGTLRRCMPGERRAYNTFHYERIRLWQMPLHPLLTGGLGTLPLAALTDEAQRQLPQVVQQIETRLRSETPSAVADKARMSLLLLLGLRYDEIVINQLAEALVNMEDSVTYQMIIRKGEERGRLNQRLEDGRRFVLAAGRKKFGPANPSIQQRLGAITDPQTLETLFERVFDVSSWDELLATLPN